MSNEFNISEKRIIALIAGVIAIIAVLSLVLAGFESVPPGHKGVIISGRSSGDVEEIDEGWHWSFKFIGNQVQDFEFRNQQVTFEGHDTSGDRVGSVTVSSADNLQVTLDYTLIYSVPADKIADLIVNNGPEYRNTIVIPIARSAPRDVASEYNALDMRGENRQVVESDISARISNELAKYNIIVEEFALRDIRLPNIIEDAIEAKKAAEQNVITEEYNLEAQRHIANQTRVNAEAEAQAVIARALGDAEAVEIAAVAEKNATIVVANGSARAVEQIKLTFAGDDVNTTAENLAYIQYLFMQALAQPDSPIEFYLIPTGEDGVPILLNTP